MPVISVARIYRYLLTKNPSKFKSFEGATDV